MAVVSSVAAFAALGPQLALAGVTLVGSEVPSAASWVGLGSWQALDGTAFACRW